MNGNELIEVKQNLFTKMKNFFRKIFARNYKKETINENNTITQYSVTKNDSKEQFFELYNKIKKGEISTFSIDIDNLQKICQMLEEECKLKEMRLKNTRDEIEIHRNNIMCYKGIGQN